MQHHREQTVDEERGAGQRCEKCYTAERLQYALHQVPAHGMADGQAVSYNPAMRESRVCPTTDTF